MKTEVLKVVKVDYIEKKRFTVSETEYVNNYKIICGLVEATLYCDELTDTIFDHGYCMHQIFNSDATCLNYKMLPRKTLAANVDRQILEQRSARNM